ncbi:hypothetical protein OEIGOIKO_06998 [Streptomyces chrestomyceticus JCM 4735]|uniref:Uncharacterized protein n=1 Tax=Streptomyces chrestomyceticus JCM 4735 TaxID=1306181 RepID=A0A7U9L177_9ACTN|nr:hypothetical protein [Streptomyces chrestomyceticus]GCD39169.1 hypothetical protein OEIGOIKO_06998 [Streptomyces chrestomyceticus JCM 4735]
MTIQSYSIDGHRCWDDCGHSTWPPCSDAAGDGGPHGWMSSDGRGGGEFFADAPWIDVAPDD